MSDIKRCRRCHRPLPRNSGDIGPVCDRIENGPARRPAAPRRKPAPAPHDPNALPGQDQMQLFFHQPTLESL